MTRDPRHDILFEPVRIGPVTAPNRFYQVPHASGMTNAAPRVRAAFRGMKAEGGWGVVCTGACSVHPNSDDTPLPAATLWDEADVRSHALTTEAVHAHGALAGVELWHGGAAAMNRTIRTPQLSPSGIPWMPTHVGFMSSQRPRVMDADDIRDLIRWHAEAAVRAEQAGFDILYVYAGMGYLPHQFLDPMTNRRTDEYGGSLANRLRLTLQIIDAVREATHGRCAVALRMSVERLRARPSEVAPSEGHEAITILGDAPDLYDVKMDSSATDCAPSRFAPEGSHESTVGFVKSLTDKPVVGVGRFTSPDTMVGQIKRGVLDLIGAARPSIADPFLPQKISEGRSDEIRECIGCNMCIASWHDGVWVRCTQNPTAGEEWRRGWHPEVVTRDGEGSVLVVGGGPAGLEAALTLGRRGYDVALAEARDELGGRLLFETSLPGLAEWRRVAEYRLGRLQQMRGVSLYPGSALAADDVVEFGADHIVLATGARWMDRLWTADEFPTENSGAGTILTPDDIAAGTMPEGPVVLFDFDNHYLGTALAEHLAKTGTNVTYVTPSGSASAWSFMTNEQPLIHAALVRAGVAVRTQERVTAHDGKEVTVQGIFGGAPTVLPAQTLVIVGERRGETALSDALRQRDIAASLTGDARAPGAIAHAIHQAHRTAQDLGRAQTMERRDFPIVAEPALRAAQ